MSSHIRLANDQDPQILKTMSFLGVIFSSVAYGVNLMLMLMCIRQSFRRGYLLGVYICVLGLLATAGFLLQVWWRQYSYTKSHQDDQTTQGYMETHFHHPIHLATTSIYVIVNWFADGILVYRCATIYYLSNRSLNFRRFVVVGPAILALLALIVIGSVQTPKIAQMATYSWQDVSVNPGLTYIFASMTIHAVASSLIIYKLCMVHRSIRRTLNQQGAGYMSIVYIMTESAFLYTSWALICVVASLTNSPGQYAVIPAMGQIQAIPPFLIMYRVAHREAVQREHISSISSVKFSTTATLRPLRLSQSLPSISTNSMSYPSPTKSQYSLDRSPVMESKENPFAFDDGHTPPPTPEKAHFPVRDHNTLYSALPMFSYSSKVSLYPSSGIDYGGSSPVAEPPPFMNQS